MNSIKLNKHGNNAAIKYHILTEDKMKKACFRKTISGWYFFKPLDNRSRISYNLSIPFDEDGRIYILDEDFCQPYDYEYLLEENPNFSLAQMIKAGAVYYTMLLQQRGILSGYTYGDYI